ncbi:MAG: ECF transporter S component [Erysipelotrichaceae bacterium]|nr:ECF transporter S component [Erysipelotrichaceae bacterium]
MKYMSIIIMIFLSLLTYVFYYYHQLNLLIILLIILSTLPFYFRYEQRKPRAREVVVLAIYIALCVSSRVLFMLTPSFKPMSALIIIAGLVFGKEFGFLCGSLSAVVSNIFFGQGPWTPYQMLALALIGFIAGCFSDSSYKQNKIFLVIIGIFSGIFYSLLMDIWGVLSVDTIFLMSRYIVMIISSLPTTLIYCISNVLFLVILTPVMLRKLERVKIKYEF